MSGVYRECGTHIVGDKILIDKRSYQFDLLGNVHFVRQSQNDGPRHLGVDSPLGIIEGVHQPLWILIIQGSRRWQANFFVEHVCSERVIMPFSKIFIIYPFTPDI